MNNAGHGARPRAALRRPLLGLSGTLIALLALLTAAPWAADAAAPPPRDTRHARDTPHTRSTSRLPVTPPARDAEPARSTPLRQIRPAHPERDWMGSTVAAHEGRIGAGTVPIVTRIT